MAGPATRRRPLAVLTMIAAAGARGITRERLVGVLWPDGTEEQGRHALAQVLYVLRRELGDALLEPGAADLRINRSVITADIVEFVDLLASGARAAALALYTGPFLDGVYLPQAPEFERWVEEERGRFAALYRRALEREASDLDAGGNPRAAAERWRELVASDPIAIEPRLRLMQALHAAGEAAAALDEARAHAATVDRELGIGPASEISALERRLRAREALPPAPGAPFIAPSVPAVPAERSAVAAPGPDASAPAGRRWTGRALAAAVILAALALALALSRRARAPVPVVAVGLVESHLSNDTLALARSLGDLIATQLVQVRGLRVIGRARLLEVLGANGNAPGPGGLARAARAAGADELIEGVLYSDPAGLRLDLRRTALDDGQVRDAVSSTAHDAVTLVETAVAALAGTWALEAPSQPLRSVTSVSLVARRFYDQGLRALYSNDPHGAADFFRVALSEDTTFAMAAYYLATSMSEAAADSAGGRWLRAMHLAEGATDRERLLILATGSLHRNDARGLAYAETLAVRYPEDLDGIHVLGELYFTRGEFTAAIDAFERVVALDSAGRRGQTASCHACDAAERGVWAAMTADSLARAERIAREMVRWPRASGRGAVMLVTVLLRRGAVDAALSAARAAAVTTPAVAPLEVAMGGMQLAGEFATLDSILTAGLAHARIPEGRSPVLRRLVEIRRESGRPRSALALAAQFERLSSPASPNAGANPFLFLPRALTLLALGRDDPRAARAAAALFDSMAAMPAYDEPRMARHRAWMWAHVASARALAGDTALLPGLARRIGAMAQRSSYGRDRRLPAYVNGLLLEARGDWEGAYSAYRAAVWSPTENMIAPRLARAALRTGRPGVAVRVLQQYLRGPLDASNQYVLRWEVHRLLGDAFSAAGRRDSAEAHYTWVRRALAEAEPAYRAIVDSLGTMHERGAGQRPSVSAARASRRDLTPHRAGRRETRISSDAPRAVQAIHEFLAFQNSDHRTDH